MLKDKNYLPVTDQSVLSLPSGYKVSSCCHVYANIQQLIDGCRDDGVVCWFMVCENGNNSSWIGGGELMCGGATSNSEEVSTLSNITEGSSKGQMNTRTMEYSKNLCICLLLFSNSITKIPTKFVHTPSSHYSEVTIELLVIFHWAISLLQVCNNAKMANCFLNCRSHLIISRLWQASRTSANPSTWKPLPPYT